MSGVQFIAPAPVTAEPTNDVLAAAYLVAAERETADKSVPSHRPRVLIESPYAAPSASGRGANQLYGRAALRDSLLRGESPMASHMLYAQTFVLDDDDPDEHALGMAAGFSWLPLVEKVVVYVDRGISEGMREGIRRARELGVTVEERSIAEWERG